MNDELASTSARRSAVQAPSAGSPSDADVLRADDLSISFKIDDQVIAAVRNVSFGIPEGATYGLVGESGCGKTTVGLAVMRYLARNASVSGGRILLRGEDVMQMNRTRLRQVRLRTISMVYQEPARALNPSIRIGKQLEESYRLLGHSRSDAYDLGIAMLTRLQITRPAAVAKLYPHSLSGGMLQRVVIGMAMACNPDVVVLDEPTTALDATVGAEVLALLKELQRDTGTAALLISHNLGLVADACDRIGVLYAGKLVEEGPAQELLTVPNHPYTVGLVRCIPTKAHHKRGRRLEAIPGQLPELGALTAGCPFAPRCPLATDVCRSTDPALTPLGERDVACHHWPDVPRLRASDAAAFSSATEGAAAPVAVVYQASPLVSIRRMTKTFGRGAHRAVAVQSVDLDIWPGEVLGLVGESGSGKTTIGRMVCGLVEPDEATEIEFCGDSLPASIRRRSHEHVRNIQIVFQSPDGSLNRTKRVSAILRRAIDRLGVDDETVPMRERVEKLADSVRFPRRYLSALPKRLSGGLKQRVAIAASFAGDPKLVVCDEPTSALDVSVQASVLNMLVNRQLDSHVAYLFISHDLAAVEYVSDRIAVLYRGRLVELGPAADVMSHPQHPYTRHLIDSTPALPAGMASTGIRRAPTAVVPQPVWPADYPSPSGMCAVAPFHYVADA